jgi:hypothetical protein
LFGPFGFDYNVIHVRLNGPPDEVFEALKHTTLVVAPASFRLNGIMM